MEIYALLSEQGTACAETALCEQHYTAEWRNAIWHQTASGYGAEHPVYNSWEDCTENDVLECFAC